jgi:hypothetical protein
MELPDGEPDCAPWRATSPAELAALLPHSPAPPRRSSWPPVPGKSPIDGGPCLLIRPCGQGSDFHSTGVFGPGTVGLRPLATVAHKVLTDGAEDSLSSMIDAVVTRRDSDYPVLIAGGGPNGLAAAIELGRAGIRCCLLETRRSVATDRTGTERRRDAPRPMVARDSPRKRPRAGNTSGRDDWPSTGNSWWPLADGPATCARRKVPTPGSMRSTRERFGGCPGAAWLLGPVGASINEPR